MDDLCTGSDRISWMAGLMRVQALMNGLWVWLFVLYSINTPFFLVCSRSNDCTFFYRFGLEYCGSLCIGF